ncbi:MAG: DUF4962 domain-containing protein [Ruminococcaceae bacterium]|nr:DUF4962 domain-containing protein [Oscillospiraceae bacterium]
MRKQGQNLRKKHTGKIITTCVLGLLALLIACVMTDILPPYTSIAKGFVEIGIDYISLDRADKKQSKANIQAALEEATDRVQHPFVLATEEEFFMVRESVKAGENGNAYINTYYNYAKHYADLLLSDDPASAPLTYELDEEDAILEISRETLERIITLGLVYKVTTDEKYALRAWEELENVCNFSDWCPTHFLDVAEMSLAVAVGYDWFYDYLDEMQKQTLVDAFLEKGLAPARSKNYLANWWVWSKTNWNSVCYGGVGIACMVFYEHCEADAVAHLSMAYNNMPINFCNFTPDGAYAEGPGYWEYGTSYLIYFIKTSNQFFGTDFGLSQYPGVEEVGAFPVYISTPTGVFNYGDNKPNALYSPVLYYYASEFANPLTRSYQNRFAEELQEKYDLQNADIQDMRGYLHSLREPAREAALSALWYCESEEVDFSALPKSIHFESNAGEELFIMRSAYLDENATCAAIKGGYNYTNHGDLDIGTFVFDALGVRWAEENGPGNYDAPGYFVSTYGGGRWKVYEKRAEGQNTLVINPKEGEDQFAFARCPVVETTVTKKGDPDTTTKEGGAAVIDMTRAYLESGVESVIRTFSLHDDYQILTVTDEVTCKKPSDIYWFMHTKAEIEIAPDGKSAMLTIGDKQCKAELTADGTFSVMDAKSLVYPDYEYNKGLTVRKLAVAVEDAQTATIVVTLTPMK